MTKIIKFSYESINTPEGLRKHCEISDIDIRTFSHTKMKNDVTNLVYCSEELNETEKFVFLFIYDLKAQQKYLPGIQITQKKIAYILGVSESTISRAIENLERYKLIIESDNRFGEKVFIPNENILTWGTAIDDERMSVLKELRKHTASSNTQLSEEYKAYKKE